MGSNNKLKELLQEARANTLKQQAFKETTIPINEFFEGTVINSTKPNETFKVKHAGTGTSLEKEFIWVGGILSSFVGFKTTFMPPLGSKVLCYIPEYGPGLVVGCIPSTGRFTSMPERQSGITKDDYKKSQIFTNKADLKKKIAFNEHRPFLDLLEGELDISNELGVGVTLLQYMAKIKAGDLAKIELSTIDDMVRIVSGCFEHITPFGDLKIFADGDRINSIWNGVLFDHESYGLLAPEDHRVPTENYEAFYDMGNPDEDRHTLTGRWRFSQFIGYLGNLVNIFVSDPVAALGKIAKEPIARSGLGRMHVNEDGSVIVQSVHDIVLERVVRVLVPVETMPEYHPEGNLSDEVLTPDPLKKWDFKSTDNMFEAVYQIREYSRWLSNYYSLARFHMMNKDYKVFSEAETPLHKEAHMDFEREKVPTPMYWQELYSCIKIMRDGSIVAMDGYANSIVMNKKGIHIASANNLHIESAGNVNIVAGHDINLVANRSIAVNAINEGLILRAKKWFQGICLENGILLQTDSPNTTDAPDDDDHKVGGIVLKSKSKVRIDAENDIEIKTKQSILTVAQSFVNKVKGFFQVNNILQIIGNGTLLKGETFTDSITSNGIKSAKTLKSGMGPHPGHVTPLPAPIPIIITPQTSVEKLASTAIKADFRHATPEQAKMPSPDTETLYESLTQQQIKTAPPITLDQQGFATWNLASECKIEGKGSCWPIDGTTHKICRGGDDLYVPSGKTVFPAEGTPLTAEAVTYKVKPD